MVSESRGPLECAGQLYAVNDTLRHSVSGSAVLQPERSFYRDNAHTIHALADLTPPGYHGLKPKVSAGGMFFLSSGSRPTNYFQPLGRVTIPCCQSVWTGSPSGRTMAMEKPFIHTKASGHT